MEWFTLEWLMKNMEWAVGLLVIGCVILFFFPILLGWQLKQDAQKKRGDLKIGCCTSYFNTRINILNDING